MCTLLNSFRLLISKAKNLIITFYVDLKRLVLMLFVLIMKNLLYDVVHHISVP